MGKTLINGISFVKFSDILLTSSVDHVQCTMN